MTIPLIVSTLAILLVGGLSYTFPPEWADEYGERKSWLKLTILSISLGLAAAFVFAYHTVYSIGTKTDFYTLVGTLSVGLVTTVYVQSLTDVRLRLVDRRMLNLANLILVSPGIALLIYEKDFVTLGVTVALLLFAAFCYLWVFSIGASDVRALTLVSVGVVPVLGVNDFLWGSLIAGLYILFWGFGVAIVKRTLRTSFPAVPMLLSPYLLTMLLILYIEFPEMLTLTANYAAN